MNYPNVHASHAELRIELDGQSRVVDLILNRQLLAKDIFLKAEHGNNTHDIYRLGHQVSVWIKVLVAVTLLLKLSIQATCLNWP